MASHQDLSKEDGLSADDFLYFVKSLEEDSSQTSNTRLIFSMPVKNIASRLENPLFIQSNYPLTTNARIAQFVDAPKNDDVERKLDDRLDIGIARNHSQNTYPESSDFQHSSLSSAQDSGSANENSIPIQSRSPVKTHGCNETFSEAFVNQVPRDHATFFDRKLEDPCNISITKRLSQNAVPGSSDSAYLSSNPARHSTTTIENTHLIQSQLPVTTHNGNVPISGKKMKPHEVPGDSAKFFDRELQPLEMSGGTYPRLDNSDLAGNSSLNNIPFEYLQLYYETRPENYDFAMNIMAYIEFLNNPYWLSTYSYFGNDVQIMIRYYWNGSKEFIDNLIQKKRFTSSLFQKLIVDFSDNVKRQNYDLGRLLNCFVILCHLGFIARERNYKETPLQVIHLIRKIIEKQDNNLVIIFEKAVKNYARELVKCL